jgi:hypothetical protein
MVLKLTTKITPTIVISLKNCIFALNDDEKTQTADIVSITKNKCQR